MRHGTPNRRSRNRGGHGGGHRQGGGNSAPNRAQVFDSNGPDVRIRGTAYQIVEKYLALAKDSASSGDQILAESYLQHAEHYQRLINEWNVQSARIESSQQADSFDRSFDTPRQPEAPQGGAEDLGLPSTILGPKRGISNPEMSDA